jgi:putative protease
LYRQLAERVLPQLAGERNERQRKARASLVESQPAKGARRPELIVRIEQATDLHLLHRDGIDAISLPASRANLHQLHQVGRRLRGKEEKLLWRLPFIIFDKDIPWYREAIKALCEWDFRRFEAANLSHFNLLSGHDVEITTDYRLFSLNSQAILSWHELGAVATTLYIEDDADNMGALLAANLPIPRRVLLYGDVPAITSKINIKDIKSDVPVMSDRGEGYRVSVRDGLTIVTPSTKFSITQFRERLQNMGCSSFILDLAHLNRDQQEQVLSAYATGRELPNSSQFNFTMGLV